MQVSGRRPMGSDDLSTVILCDPCKGVNEEENAVFYCAVCNEFLCGDCTKAHKKAKLLKNHQLLDRNSMPSQKTLTSEDSMCSKHTGKLIEYFCFTHNDCCCSICTTIEHRQCKVQYIDDMAAEFEESKACKSLAAAIEDGLQLLRNTRKLSVCNKDNVQSIHSQFVAEVKACRAEMNQLLDSLESDTLKEAQALLDTDIKSTESVSITCDVFIADLEAMSSSFAKHKKFKQRRQLVISATKVQNKLKQYGRETVELKNQCQIREYAFRQNESIVRSIKAASSLVQFEDRKERKVTTIKERVNVQGVETTSKNSELESYRYVCEVNTKHATDSSKDGCGITGGVVVDTKRLALVDNNNSSVKIVDVSSMKVISALKLSQYPWGITRVGRDQIAVTCEDELVFLKISPTLSVMKELVIGGDCRGIVYTNNTLIVSFGYPDSCVRILNLDGHIVNSISSDKTGENLFSNPWYIALSNDQKSLYVSDYGNDSVTRIDLDGTVQYVYTHDRLKDPYGVTVAGNQNIYIAGWRSNNVHLISPQCAPLQVLQDGTAGMARPQTIIYCEKNKRIYVCHCSGPGNLADNSVSVYQVE